VKPADDDSGDLVVRLWESRGGRTSGTVHLPGLEVVSRCDALETPDGEAWRAVDGTVRIGLEAFQIVTLRLSGDFVRVAAT
jgi:alpha-mannosidase